MDYANALLIVDFEHEQKRLLADEKEQAKARERKRREADAEREKLRHSQRPFEEVEVSEAESATPAFGNQLPLYGKAARRYREANPPPEPEKDEEQLAPEAAAEAAAAPAPAAAVR